MARLLALAAALLLAACCTAKPAAHNSNKLRSLEDVLLKTLLEKRASGYAAIRNGNKMGNVYPDEASGVTQENAITAIFDLKKSAETAFGNDESDSESVTNVQISTNLDEYELTYYAGGFMLRGNSAKTGDKALADATVSDGETQYLATVNANGDLVEYSSSVADKEASKARLTGVVAAAVDAKAALGGATLNFLYVKSASYAVYIYPSAESGSNTGDCIAWIVE